MTPQMTKREEQRIGRPLVRAIRKAADGPGLSVRVAEIMRRPPKTRGQWIPVERKILSEMIARLDGPASAARHLGVAQSTIRRWADRSRIPAWALDRFVELIAAGAPSKRRPNRARDRHYLSDEP